MKIFKFVKEGIYKTSDSFTVRQKEKKITYLTMNSFLEKNYEAEGHRGYQNKIWQLRGRNWWRSTDIFRDHRKESNCYKPGKSKVVVTENEI